MILCAFSFNFKVCGGCVHMCMCVCMHVEGNKGYLPLTLVFLCGLPSISYQLPLNLRRQSEVGEHGSSPYLKKKEYFSVEKEHNTYENIDVSA